MYICVIVNFKIRMKRNLLLCTLAVCACVGLISQVVNEKGLNPFFQC